MRISGFVLNLAVLACLAAPASPQKKTQQKKENPPAADPLKPTVDPTKPSSEGKPLTPEEAKIPPGPGAPVDPKSYKLGPEDIVWISVWREPELSRVTVVRPDGKITLPLIGEIQAGNLTPEQLGKGITEALSQIMTKPEVTISVQQVNSRRYYIVGEVQKPGPFPLAVPTTVLEAISAAGGLREFANEKGIVIVRGDKRLKFNYKDVVKGKNLQQNVLLEPGDQIIVR